MALRLEVFESPDRGKSQTIVTDAGAVEESKLAAYEQGYKAGWDDAVSARAAEYSNVMAEIEHNFQKLSFTYHEARVHVLKSIEPLLRDITGKLLPEIARDALAPIILDTLMPMTEELADTPISLVVNPNARTAIETLLQSATGLPLVISEEPSLGEGQVYIRLGQTETHVDLDRAITAIAAAVHSFFTLETEDENYV